MQAAVELTEEFVEIGIDEEKFVKLDTLDEVVDEIKELGFEDEEYLEGVEEIEEELKLLDELDIETTVELDDQLLDVWEEISEKFTVLLGEPRKCPRGTKDVDVMTKLDDTEDVELIEDEGETVDEFAEGRVRRVA